MTIQSTYNIMTDPTPADSPEVNLAKKWAQFKRLAGEDVAISWGLENIGPHDTTAQIARKLSPVALEYANRELTSRVQS